MHQPRVALVVPTFNAGLNWERWLEAFQSQTLKPPVLIIDSSSTDQTVELATQAGFRVHSIKSEDFDHGATRQLGADLVPEAEVLVYMTQDAILEGSQALENLLAAFGNPKVGVAYGRQLPHKKAKPIGAHARLFNYPSVSEVRSKDDIFARGIKAAFNSDSFAAYRAAALREVGGFPQNSIVGEDNYVAAKMLLSDWKVAYVSEARVYHSHDYTWLQEAKRYFDIGVFHARASDLLSRFGGAEGEGLRFVRSEMNYLARNAPLLIPSAVFRTFAKYVFYRLGKAEARLPDSLKQHLAMHRSYFLNQQSQ